MLPPVMSLSSASKSFAYQRPLSLVSIMLNEEREELEEISFQAKEGHPPIQKHCEMCNEKRRPCWTPHLKR